MNRNVSRNVPRNKLVACLEGVHIFILLLIQYNQYIPL